MWLVAFQRVAAWKDILAVQSMVVVMSKPSDSFMAKRWFLNVFWMIVILRCETDYECGSQQLCKDYRCQQSCNECGVGADCRVVNHRPVCECPKVSHKMKMAGLKKNKILTSLNVTFTELFWESTCWMSCWMLRRQRLSRWTTSLYLWCLQKSMRWRLWWVFEFVRKNVLFQFINQRQCIFHQ